MKRKSRNELDQGSFFLEFVLEIIVYLPRLVIRLFKWIID